MSREPKRFCITCAAQLTGRTHASFCSAGCRLRAHRAKLRTDADSRRCKHCGLPLLATAKLSAIYCGDSCRQAGRRGGGIPKRKAHQAREHGTHRLDGYAVATIDNEVARDFILTHEWLGSMPSSPQACYGLLAPEGVLVGVAVFGRGSEPMRREFGQDAVALERGGDPWWRTAERRLIPDQPRGTAGPSCAGVACLCRLGGCPGRGNRGNLSCCRVG